MFNKTIYDIFSGMENGTELTALSECVLTLYQDRTTSTSSDGHISGLQSSTGLLLQ